ncbi:LOW QUALITY PROTEIN: calpain-9-like [Babylonia areolata]|uniref:LOW QUALITY PROTEIN: calpain-9-like n=1 Tax=Babylonia areolata TaxID=304850 RepID=UPI003FCFCDD0
MFSGFTSGGGTRTVKTFFSDGKGPAKVETKTYTIGGPGGSSIGYTSGGGGGFGAGDIDLGFGDTFGGRGVRFGFGGGDQDGGFGGFRFKGFSSGPAEPGPKPKISGRPQRTAQRNPFAGLTDQKYADIKSKCLEQQILFEDPEFLAEDDSIFFSRRPPRRFEWKRPHEICDDPQWISEGASRFDVRQGELGDCWLLAAVASLTCNQTLFNKVVPPDQSFSDSYCGLFRFNFWHQGDWKEVVVDDRLPTYNGQLVFMHSTEKNEFWSALLEKAYAKLTGSYESLKGGSTSEAMEDFTGGVTEMFELRGKHPPNLLAIMLKAHERGSLMGCSIDADPGQLEAQQDNGLIMGHAYSITSVSLMDIKTSRIEGQIPMVRVRNPWGNECEWKGAWSDSSQEWSLISDDEKEELGLKKDDDGEFWMSFKDFTAEFQKLEICNLGPDSLDDLDVSNKKRWEMHKEHGGWVRRVNAGGCRNYLETFWTNPQYRMTLTDPDDDDDEDLCTAIVAVLQKDRRKKRKEGLDLLTIGYVIYKVEEGQTGPLDLKFFKYNASVAKSPTFINMREVCGRHKLEPGTYCIIPSTFEPQQEGDFLVRIFSEKANTSGEMDEQTSYVDDGRRRRYQPSPQPGAPITPRWVVGYQTGVSPEEAQEEVTPIHVAPVASVPPHLHGGAVAQAMSRKVASGLRERPEPTEEEQEQESSLKQNFRKIAGEDMEIDAFELQEILNAVFQKDERLQTTYEQFAFSGFTIDATRSMVAMHDGDLSGKLGYDEFKDLWEDLRRWKGVFKEYDHDQSGNLNSFELRAALNSVGFRLSNRTLQSLVMRYSNREGKIDFGDFIVCAVRLKTMLNSFRGLDPENQGFAPYDIESFIQTTMYS